MIGTLVRRFVENPLVGRALGASLTGPRLGGAFLLVGAVLLVLWLTLFVVFTEPFFSLTGTAPAGRILHFALHVALWGLLCLLVPLKLAGHIEGLRLGRAFDQVVVTGASPLRFHLGNWAVGLLYAALLCLGTLPFQGSVFLFGGVETGDALRAYGVQLLYVNLVILVSIALSVFEREWITVPLTVILFLFLGMMGLILDSFTVQVWPQHLAEATPLRWLWRDLRPFPIVDRVAGVEDFVLGDPWFFGWRFPLEVFPFLLWGAVGAAAFLLAVLGPGHRFPPGMNNFGTVVLPGDRRKRLLRKTRGLLARRVELAFFYENRARWCDGWDFPLKLLLSVVGAVFLFGVFNGVVLRGFWMAGHTSFFEDERVLGSLALCALTLGGWILLWCDPRYRVYARERLGRIRFPRELGIGLGFALIALVLLVTQVVVLDGVRENWLFGIRHGLVQTDDWGRFSAAPEAFATVRESLEEASSGARDTATAPGEGAVADMAAAGHEPTAAERQLVDDHVRDGKRFTWGLLLFGITLLLGSRLASRLTHSVAFSRVVTTLGGFLLFLTPMLCYGLAREVPQVPAFVERLGAFSPFFLVDDAFRRPGDWSSTQRTSAYVVAQGLLAALLLLSLGLLHLRARRRGTDAGPPRAGPRPAESPSAGPEPVSSGEAPGRGPRAEPPGGSRGSDPEGAGGSPDRDPEARPDGAPARGNRPGGGAGPTALLIAGILGAGSAAEDLDAQPRTGGMVVRGEAQEERPPGPAPFEVVEAVRGFDGVVFSDDVDFYTVVVRNRSDTTRRLHVGTTWYGGRWSSGGPGEFELGPGTTRRIAWRPVTARPSRSPQLQVADATGHRVPTQLRRRVITTPASGDRDSEESLDAYLFIGEDARPVTDAVLPPPGGEHGRRVPCRPLALPEHPADYIGVSAVFVGPQDLSRWTEGQRGALLDYVRLGGTVIFHGGLDESGRGGLGAWDPLLRSRGRREAVGGMTLPVEELEEGRTVLSIEHPEGGARVPLLVLRSVGPGWVGHLGLDPTAAHVPASVGPGDVDPFRRSLADAIPSSRFPLDVEPGFGTPPWLRDYGSMALVLGYLSLYVLVLVLALAFFFRRRERRVLMWAAVPAAAGLVTAGLPFLAASLRARPSLAAYHDVAWVRAGSKEASVLGDMRVESAGRQDHDVVIGARAPRVWTQRNWRPSSMVYRYSSGRRPVDLDRFGPPLPGLVPLDDPPGGRARLHLAPWGEAGFRLLGSLRLEASVEGTARIERAGPRGPGELRLDARLPPALRRGEMRLILLGLPGGEEDGSAGRGRPDPAHAERWVEVPAAGPEGRVSVRWRLDGAQVDLLREEAPRAFGSYELAFRAGFRLLWSAAQGPSAILEVVPPPGEPGPMPVTSDGLAFEVPLRRELDERSRHRYGEVHEREDGTRVLSLHHRAVLVEFPLETSF